MTSAPGRPTRSRSRQRGALPKGLALTGEQRPVRWKSLGAWTLRGTCSPATRRAGCGLGTGNTLTRIQNGNFKLWQRLGKGGSTHYKPERPIERENGVRWAAVHHVCDDDTRSFDLAAEAVDLQHHIEPTGVAARCEVLACSIAASQTLMVSIVLLNSWLRPWCPPWRIV